MSLLSLPVVSVESVVASRLCQGCGACATKIGCAEGAITLLDVDDTGIRPFVDKDLCTGCGKCVEVCSGVLHDRAPSPLSGQIEQLYSDWGPVQEVWEGHAADREIQFEGGSGGGATALCLYLLECEGGAGVLHIGGTPDSPLHNSPYVSRDRLELLSRSGSRYSPAAPASGLDVISGAAGPMAMIGKPCDIASARLASAVDANLRKNLSLAISVFCGGTPSTKGTKALLKAVGISEEDATDVRYRGRGWPGNAGAGRKSDPSRRGELSYREAWDNILTKHVQFRCKICPDGTGEHADISCGDPWYRPIEPGELGKTLFLIRTDRGRELFHRAMASGYIVAERRDASVVEASQRGLLARRRNVFPKLMWMRALGLKTPSYRRFGLLKAWMELPLGWRIKSLYRSGRSAVGLWRRGKVSFDRRDARPWPKVIERSQQLVER